MSFQPANFPVEPSENRSAHKTGHLMRFFVHSAKSEFAVASCLELIDHANQFLGVTRYRTEISYDLSDLLVASPRPMDTSVLLFGNIEGVWLTTSDEQKVLRSKLPCVSRLGIVGGAVFALTNTPLSRSHRICVHQTMLEAALEEGFALPFTSRSFHRDKQVYSAIGGLAAMYMILDMIADDCGEFLADRIARHVGLDNAPRTQKAQLQDHYAQRSKGQGLLLQVLEIMTDNIETPLQSREIAARTGVSPRHMERAFREVFDESPMEVYRSLKLERARQLLSFSNLSVLEVSLASGFGSLNAMSKRYKQKFGRTPSAERARRFGG